jgi:hypothetical protein
VETNMKESKGRLRRFLMVCGVLIICGLIIAIVLCTTYENPPSILFLLLLAIATYLIL